MQAEARKRTSERSRAGANVPNSDCNGFTVGCMVCGRFRLDRSLDHKARIWKATDDSNHSHVLKTGPNSLVEREFQTLSTLSHPNIIDAADCFDCEASRYLVLEYLPGGDLVSLAGQSPNYWLDPIAGVIDALGYLHRRGIVHRDLKARNVLLDAAGSARLIDFESALEVGSRWSFGGTTEAAVEPARGDAPVSTADDVYALTSLLHEMLYGMPPGTGERKSCPQWAEALARLVDSSLAAPSANARPGLDRFTAVVELMQGMRRNLQ